MSGDGALFDRATPWRAIVRLAMLGTLGTIMWVLFHMGGLGANPLTLIQPGADGPSVEAIRADFPEAQLPDGLGLDGQQFYAIARNPFDLDDAATHLDRPEYRLRRPAYAWAAWALHPTGGGEGLVLALAAVSLLAVLGGGIAAGALSTGLGGPAWPAALIPLLPGSYMSLRVSVADAMAVALTLAALAFAVRRRHAPAVACAVGAVFSKETMILVLIGWALAQRTKRDAALVAIPAALLGAWMLWLRVTLPDGGPEEVREIVPPFSGFPKAIEYWLDGNSRLGMVTTCAALVGAALALLRGGVRHPLSWAVLANLALVSVMHWNVLALDFGATRSMMPLLAVAIVMVATADHVRGATSPAAELQDAGALVAAGATATSQARS
mgnify:CR=1 FL=1